ncbi:MULTISPECIES: transcription antitermination factor NusB [unclassified Chelatococcus]|uniref:RsmB/NOP family class I SAM-dependent RNA methyltransferase n=1 Tax=unclassified Chelatococcus TaxID=2638111 RepID=UPI0020BF3B8E|nr:MULTISPECIES: transcription antitermination factor NusB [unclassified Chelatococcus]
MKPSVPAHRGRSRRDDPPGLAARRMAAAALTRILGHSEGLEDLFDGTAARRAASRDSRPAGVELDLRDRALARAITTAALRRLGTLRKAIGDRLQKGLPRNSGALEAILLVGAAQLLLLDVPDHAAVTTAVDLARGDKRAFPYAKLVNAVLRRIAADREAILAATDPFDVDTPTWLRSRWSDAYGEATARQIAAAHGREPSIDITVKADAPHWAEQLGGLLLPTGSIRLTTRTPVAELPGYAEGAWWVQDAAAAVPARLLRVRPGETVLDLCAAPGGKTAQLAAAGADVTAVDRAEARLERLKENMKRLRLTAACRRADAGTFQHPPADAVLLDAPCSATGTIRRHPDVAWTKRPEDIAALALIQQQLLDHAASLVKPRGVLVYCTCSLEPEEGEAQTSAFLARHPEFRREAIAAAEVGGVDHLITRDGDFRSLPSASVTLADGTVVDGFDGFYAARLRRSDT